MAKSIFEILADLTTETSVPGHGDSIAHTIPRKLFPEPEVFEDGSKLLEWAEKNGYTQALLQQGLQKGLIDCRAKFKSCKKDDIWSVSYGQQNVDSHKWTITERPNAATSKKVDAAILAAGIKIAQAMANIGLANDVISKALEATYNNNIIKEILNEIER